MPSATIWAQSDILFTNGKIKKAYVFNKDFYHVQYATKKLENINEAQVAELEAAIEKQYLKDIYEVNKKYSAKLVEYKKKSKDEVKLAEFEAGNTINRTAKEEKIRKKKSTKQANLRYTGLRKTRRENVFSITSADGREEVIYTSDTLGFLDSSKVDVEFTEAEMRRFIKGEQDGRKVKSPLTTFVSGGLGVAGGIFGAFFGPVVPAVYFSIVAVKKKNKALERQVPINELRDDNAYMDGFSRTAKRQKVKNAAIGGAVGLAVGVGGLLIYLVPR